MRNKRKQNFTGWVCNLGTNDKQHTSYHDANCYNYRDYYILHFSYILWNFIQISHHVNQGWYVPVKFWKKSSKNYNLASNIGSPGIRTPASSFQDKRSTPRLPVQMVLVWNKWIICMFSSAKTIIVWMSIIFQLNYSNHINTQWRTKNKRTVFVQEPTKTTQPCTSVIQYFFSNLRITTTSLFKIAHAVALV